jgi:hypothetical protein
MTPPSHMGLQPLSQMGQQPPSTGLVVRGSSEVVGLGHGGCVVHALVKTCCWSNVTECKTALDNEFQTAPESEKLHSKLRSHWHPAASQSGKPPASQSGKPPASQSGKPASLQSPSSTSQLRRRTSCTPPQPKPKWALTDRPPGWLVKPCRRRSRRKSACSNERSRAACRSSRPTARKSFFLERFFTLAAQRMRSPTKKNGMRSHSPRKGQWPRSSCLAAAKGALSESGSQGRRFCFFFPFFLQGRAHSRRPQPDEARAGRPTPSKARPWSASKSAIAFSTKSYTGERHPPRPCAEPPPPLHPPVRPSS